MSVSSEHIRRPTGRHYTVLPAASNINIVLGIIIAALGNGSPIARNIVLFLVVVVVVVVIIFSKY